MWLYVRSGLKQWCHKRRKQCLSTTDASCLVMGQTSLRIYSYTSLLTGSDAELITRHHQLRLTSTWQNVHARSKALDHAPAVSFSEQHITKIRPVQHSTNLFHSPRKRPNGLHATIKEANSGKGPIHSPDHVPLHFPCPSPNFVRVRTRIRMDHKNRQTTDP